MQNMNLKVLTIHITRDTEKVVIPVSTINVTSIIHVPFIRLHYETLHVVLTVHLGIVMSFFIKYNHTALMQQIDFCFSPVYHYLDRLVTVEFLREII